MHVEDNLKKPMASEITEDTIKDWKEKFGGGSRYATKDGLVAYFRSPERKEIEAAQSVGNKPLQSNAILAKACFLGGDEKIISENKYFYGLQEHLQQIIKKVEGELTEF